MSKHTKCLICKSPHLKRLDRYYQLHKLLKCKSCGFVFVESIPTKDELDLHYGQYSYKSQGYLSPITVKSYNSLLNEFESYRKNGRILDVGCGRGWFLKEAKKRGWDIYGTEYSDLAVQICRENGININSGQLKVDSFLFDHFDVITSFEVIEHINNPIEELIKVRSFLREGGLFYCTTPNFNSILRYYLRETYDIIGYPEHLCYYTFKTHDKLMRKGGFICNKFLCTGISVTRLKNAKGKSREKSMSKTSSDEILRSQIESHWLLGLLKKSVNYFLNIFKLGMTLKGYYIKEEL